jgi:hypothetical protein
VSAAVEWDFRPWRDAPGMAWGAGAALAALGVLLVALHLPVLLKAALWVLLGLAVEPALLRSRFRVDDEGLSRTTRLGTARLRWAAARRRRRHRLGLEVGGEGPAWLPGEGRRLRLFIPRRERERVLAALEAKRASHGA